MTTSNQIPATESQDFVTIPEYRYPRILWDLRVIENTFRFLHNRLQDLQKADESLLMTVSETAGFSKVFFEAFDNWHEITMQLKQADDCEVVKIGEQFMKYVNYARFVVNFFSQREGVNGKSTHELDHDGIYDCDLEGILLLTNKICSEGFPCCIKLLEETFSNKKSGNSHDCIDDREQNYESRITKRIKAIEPKFNRLCDKYADGDAGELSSNPGKLGWETKKLRDEIWQLQNQMPANSEEGMDCRLVIDQLDFLIKLIDSKFAFKNSDIIPLSVIVSGANSVFSKAINWLTLGEGGGDAENPLH